VARDVFGLCVLPWHVNRFWRVTALLSENRGWQCKLVPAKRQREGRWGDSRAVIRLGLIRRLAFQRPLVLRDRPAHAASI